MIKQFNIPQSQQGEELGQNEKNLCALTDRVNVKNYEIVGMISKDPEKDDGTDGWINEITLLSV
jgi:hypothetical protein